MNRQKRLDMIKSIISEGKVKRQNDLVAALAAQGIPVTQATLSRDIRDIGIAKIHHDGESYYAVLNSKDNAPHFQAIFQQFVLTAKATGSLIVAHTRLGEADLLANAIDSSEMPEILGTIAGADTLLIICQTEQDTTALLAEITQAIDSIDRNV